MSLGRLATFMSLAFLLSPLAAEAGGLVPTRKPAGLLGGQRGVPMAAPRPVTAIAEASGPPARPWRLWGAAGTWFLPAEAGSATIDFGFSRPTWTLEGGLDMDDWGLGCRLISFGETRAAFRPAPYLQAQTALVDLTAFRRLSGLPLTVFVGYRGLGQADVNFAIAGAGYERAFPGSPLRLVARAQGGLAPDGSAVVDGEARLAYPLGPLALQLGMRHMSLLVAGDPWFPLTGPTLGLEGRF